MDSKLLLTLLQKVWQSPVFGDSFDLVSAARQKAAAQQMKLILADFAREMKTHLAVGMPELNDEQLHAIIQSMAAKTVGFCPALSGGEIDDTARLGKLAVLIALTGWGNQSIDRGDEAMPLAVLRLCGQDTTVPDVLAGTVAARLAGLKGIETKIHGIALPEDKPLLLRASRDELMLHEVLAHRLSLDYFRSADKNAFLETNAARGARILTVTGALPSAITPLYAIYRQQDARLPSLAEIYAQPNIIEFLQVANTFIRVLDDLGDRDIDNDSAGSWSAPSLNLFNQAHPALIREFLRQAHIADAADVQMLQAAFAAHPQNTDAVKDFFVQHIRTYTKHLPMPIATKYAKYIQLCKRALEAGYINQVGDIALAG